MSLAEEVSLLPIEFAILVRFSLDANLQLDEVTAWIERQGPIAELLDQRSSTVLEYATPRSADRP